MHVFDKSGVKYCVRSQIPSSFNICSFIAETNTTLSNSVTQI